MQTQPLDTKERILNFLRQRGPSLPVHIAKDIGSSILFTSAYLSELLSEKRLKMSHMKIGSSSLYFVDGQEQMLEKFSHHLKSKEKEAFMILAEKRFLKDSEQLPAIRIALREIKDFAVPFRKNDEIIWKFFNTSEGDFKEEAKIPIVKDSEAAPNVIEVIKENITEGAKEAKDEPLEVVEKIILHKKESKKTKTKIKPKAVKKKSPAKTKTDEKFLNKIKEFLSKDSIEIVNIEGLKRDELVLRVKIDGVEQLLVAYKKSKISEKEIIKAAKKANELQLSYSILSMGELPKRFSELKDALQNIKDIKRVE